MDPYIPFSIFSENENNDRYADEFSSCDVNGANDIDGGTTRRRTEEGFEPRRLSMMLCGDEDRIEEDNDDHRPVEQLTFHHSTNGVPSTSFTHTPLALQLITINLNIRLINELFT